MTALRRAYFASLKYLVVACMAGIVVLIFGNVLLRYGFNSGLYFSEEVSRFLFVWLVFAGALLVLHERGHIGMDSLVRRLPLPAQRAAFLLTHLLMLYVTWLFLEGSWRQTLINLNVGAPATGLSMAFFYGTGVVFSLASGGALIAEIVRLLTGAVAASELVIARSEDEAEAERLTRETPEFGVRN